MKHYFVLLLFSFSLVSCAQERPTKEEKVGKVDLLLKAWNNAETPGAAVGIIRNGTFVYASGYGLANLEHSVAITDNTAFNLASNSKRFTAACIVILSLRGELNLSQSVSELFPEFPAYFSKITIEHLLNHTSGLRDFSQISYLSGLRPDDYYNDEDILKWISAQQALNFEPGEKHLYSNSGYWLLGQIVEKVSGMTLAAFAKKELFAPLNMSNTLFYDNNSLIVKNRASGYFLNRSGKYRQFNSTLEHTGNGGVFSTLSDLKKWDDEFYNRKILTDEFWKLMSTPGKLNNGETIAYAKGLIIGEHNGLKTIDHGGRAPGYLSNMVRFPKEKLTIIVLANTTNLNASRMCYDIANIFLYDQVENVSQSPTKSFESIKMDAASLEQFAGHYWNSKNNISRRVILSNDTLKYERSRGRTHPLIPTSQSTFKMLGTPLEMDVNVSFTLSGESAFMHFEENGDEVDQWERYQPINYNTSELLKFSGLYYNQEIKTFYELKMEDQNQLFLYINEQRTVPLRPVMENLFSSPIGIFRFAGSEEKGITAVYVSTPRVKKLLFLKSGSS